MMALINSKSKLNTKIFGYAAKLSLIIQKTYVNDQKIDNFFMEIYNIVIIIF